MLILAHNPSHQACRHRMINRNGKQFYDIYLPYQVLFCIHAIYFSTWQVSQLLFFHIPWGYIKTTHVIQQACIPYHAFTILYISPHVASSFTTSHSNTSTTGSFMNRTRFVLYLSLLNEPPNNNLLRRKCTAAKVSLQARLLISCLAAAHNGLQTYCTCKCHLSPGRCWCGSSSSIPITTCCLPMRCPVGYSPSFFAYGLPFPLV